MDLLHIPHKPAENRVYHRTYVVEPRKPRRFGIPFWLALIVALAAIAVVMPDRSSAADLDVGVSRGLGGANFVVDGNYGKHLDLRVYASKTKIHFRSINRQHKFIKDFDPNSNDPDEANLRLCQGYSSSHLVCPVRPFFGSGNAAAASVWFFRNEGGRVSGFSNTSNRCASERSGVSLQVYARPSSLKRQIFTGNLSDEVEILGRNTKANTCGGSDSLSVFDRATGHAGTGDDGIGATGKGSRVYGDSGNDSLSATKGAIAFGNSGTDDVGVYGNSRGYGGSGNDFVSEAVGFESANYGMTRLYGGSGNDRLNSGGGSDYLNGGRGRDLLEADSRGRRKMVGRVPYTILIPGARDKLIGGQGRDRSLAGHNSILRSIESPKWLPVWVHPLYGQVPDPR